MIIKTTIVVLAYTITSSGSRRITIMDKILKVNGSIVTPKDTFITIVNTIPITIYWLLGFIIVDGNIYMRICHTGLEFLPSIRIIQKNTTINIRLFTIIIDFLTTHCINCILEKGVNLNLRILGKNNVINFIKLLPEDGYF